MRAVALIAMSTHTPADVDGTTRPKSVLVCPECGHESLASGDWDVVERESGAVYECPVCHRTIARRGTATPVCHC